MKYKKIQKDHKPFHLHLEYFFRKQYCVYAVLALMSVAVLKTDGKMLNMMRQAYAEGFGVVGQYMREETARMPVTINMAARIPTISGK
jgi:hypothetical protein